MSRIHPLAADQNRALQKNKSLWRVLSKRAKLIYFPKTGTLGQTDEARGKKFNATIGIALEDDGSPMRIASIARHIDLDPREVFPYASSYGVPALRAAWRKSLLQKNPHLRGIVSLPVVAGGITHCLWTAGTLFLDPGDDLILANLHWDNYPLVFQGGFGAHLAYFPTFKGGGFNTEGLRRRLASRKGKKVVLLNFPNNPTGYTCTVKEAKEIVSILVESASSGNDIVTILDDAYMGLVYKKGVLEESLFALLSRAHERILAVKLDGCTKEDFGWGLRVGFVTFAGKNLSKAAAISLEDKTGAAVRLSASSASMLSQNLLLKAYTSPSYSKEKAQKRAILRGRYLRSREILHDPKFKKYWTLLPCNSGYFLCLKLKNNLSAEKVRKLLLSEFNTGVIAFGDLIRIAYSSVAERKLKQLYENVFSACEKIARH